MYTYILVLLFGAVGSIVLPGPCPNVPPTHFNCRNFSGDIITAEVIFIIPFAPQRPSYMFKNYNKTVPLATNDINFMQNCSKIIFEFASSFSYPFYSRSVGNIETKNPSIAMNGAVYKQFPRNHGSLVASKCDSIEEDIRLWCDGKFLLVWSCYNNVSEHDEALILFVTPSDPNSMQNYESYDKHENNINMYNEMMQRFNATSKKYLGQSEILLGDHFEWKRTPEYKFETEYTNFPMGPTLFPCAHQETGYPMLTIAVIVLLGVGIWWAVAVFSSY